MIYVILFPLKDSQGQSDGKITSLTGYWVLVVSIDFTPLWLLFFLDKCDFTPRLKKII